MQAARISGAPVGHTALVLLFCHDRASEFICAAFAGQKSPAVPAIRWADGQPGCTFSLDDDGKYRYGLWTTAEWSRFSASRSLVRYRGQGTLAVDPEPATLEFVKHSKVMQRLPEPESFALRAQDDADELKHETEREIAKHPDGKKTVRGLWGSTRRKRQS